MTELPAVATNTLSQCKKCGEERYHKVLAHKTEKSAQIQCEVCGAKKTIRKTSATAKKKAGRKTSAAAQKKVDEHKELFQNLCDRYADQPQKKYTMKEKFEVGNNIQHPKFGLGIVQSALPGKIEVVFPETTRLLIHERQ